MSGHDGRNGPEISPRSVRAALRQLAAERVPADGPLIDLVLVTRLLERHGSPNNRPARQWALGQVLSETVEAELERLRRRVGPIRAPLEGPSAPNGRVGGQRNDGHAAAIDALRQDFSHDDAILEGCSAVYHLHLRPDLGLSTTRLAALVAGRHARTVQRRLALGLAHVAGRLAAIEAEAVANARRQRVLHRLPSPAGGRLFGVDPLVARIAAWLADPRGAAALALSGPGGCGKSVVAAAALRAAIEGEAALRVAWIRAVDRHSGQALPAPVPERRVAEAAAVWTESTEPGGGTTTPSSLRALRAACAAVGARPGALVVIDGVDDAMEMAAIARRVAKGHSLPRLLITSRLCWSAVAVVETVAVPPLDAGAALALLRHEGRRRGLPGVASASDTALAALAAATQGHPAALIVAAAELRAASMDQVAWRFQHGAGRPGMLLDRIWRRAWRTAPAEVQHVVEAVAEIERRDGAADPTAVATSSGLSAADTEAALCSALDLGLLTAVSGRGTAFATPPFLAAWRARDPLGIVGEVV